jgi:inward rectifier potassium channel
VLLMAVEGSPEQLRRNYKQLNLERPHVYFFPLTWTVVHPIDESSPLFGKTAKDLEDAQAEFLVLIKGFDDTFSQTVHARYSYRHEDLVWDARFLPAFNVGEDGTLILDLHRVNNYVVSAPGAAALEAPAETKENPA